MSPPAFDPALYLVTDERLAGSRGVVETVRVAIEGGVTMVQLRDPEGKARRQMETARALIALLRPRGIPLIINDRVDIALAVDADGVHVGQQDIPPAAVRQMIGPNRILGLSVTSPEEASFGDLATVDYLGVGPIFPQATKSDAAPPMGLAGLAAVRGLTPLPIVAIGGVGAANAAEILASGADGLAVVSAIMAADDPVAAARAIAAAIGARRG